MQLYEIPLSPVAQRFPILLNGMRLHITMAWRNVGGAGWVIDLHDMADAPIVQGIPLVTGADLLAQFKHLGIPGGIFASTDGDMDAVPTFTNIGIDSHVWFMAVP